MKIFLMALAAGSLFLSARAGSSEPVEAVLVGIYAQDYGRTVAWYRNHFGFDIASEHVNDAANIRIGFLDNGAFELEIYADIEPAQDHIRLKRERFGMPTEGFVKLTFRTGGLQQLSDSLAAAGVSFVREINESDRKPGMSSFMVQDPDGNLIQVLGPTP